MRVANVAFLLSIFIIPGIFSYFTCNSLPLIWLNYGIWFSMTAGFYVFVNFALLASKARKSNDLLLATPPTLRACAFVVSYNENPELVKGTLFSVKSALNDGEAIFLLDDSTDKNIVGQMRAFCKSNDINYLHRENRKGFKAGAINEALGKIYGKYDLVAIFDADQRPLPAFFHETIPYFNDTSVALVQVPQTYTELQSQISEGALYQQEPFLRILMKGRSDRSAFSIGSGSVFRVSALMDVGGFVESSITEDVATSLRLQERGYKSIYVDMPLIWYGEPPKDLGAYMSQQGRWSFGYFQITKDIMTRKISFSQFFDYITGTLYWLKEGIITVFELLGPMVFLIFKVPFLKLDPVIYALAYVPYLVASMLLYALLIRKINYGISGFYLHQVVEYLAFPAIVISFIYWLAGQKRPFKVTPKEVVLKHTLKFVIPVIVILALLVLSDVMGILWYLSGSTLNLKLAIIMNLFWASYQIPFLVGGVVISLNVDNKEKENLIK
ncbi:MAG: glycosyltransferase family 2 protein [Thermoplasmata archaeon]